MILDLFDKSNNAISVVDLISTFNNKMNKTTVYRILNRLEESGILHSFSDKDGLKRYAKNFSKLKPRSAIIAFNINNIYEIAENLRSHRGGAAVVLGS